VNGDSMDVRYFGVYEKMLRNYSMFNT
jgi:hypothetical protein